MLGKFNIFKVLNRLKELGIKFQPLEDAVENKETSIVTKNGFPNAIYIPLSDIPRIIDVIKKIYSEIEKESKEFKR